MNYLDLVGSAQDSSVEVQTMSSLEIANLTGKLHPDVTRDIIRILKEVEIDPEKYRGEYLAKNGKKYRSYNLPRRECDLVVSGYSARYRLAIIDKWHVLELDKQESQKALGLDEKLLSLRDEMNRLYERD